MPLFRFKDKLVLFVHIPKTGGTSMARMLAEMGGLEALRQPTINPDLPCTPQHFHASILRDLIPIDFVDLAFTVVRNPYERLASEYRMRVQQPGRDMSFDEWVERMFRCFGRNPYFADNHIRPQSHFLLPGVRQLRFEASPFEDIIAALAEFGIVAPREIPWERNANRLPITISQETAASIGAFYEEDFRRLDYSWEDFGNTLRLV